MKYGLILFLSLLILSPAHSFKKIPQDIEKMLQEAVNKAYIPEHRSKYKVGTVFETNDGQITTGSNVKLPCGLTMCAERIALYKILTQSSKEKDSIKIKKIYVDNHKGKACIPCGVCLQALAPFVTEDTTIFYRDGKGNFQNTAFKALLPYPFVGEQY